MILVHIPLDLYPFFGQTILSLLFSDVPSVKKQETTSEDEERPKLPTHGFLNFSVTPVECSVICSREAAERYFVPLANRFAGLAAEDGPRVSISKDDFIVMQVDGQGLDAGQRVLELTSPLAMAGMYVLCSCIEPKSNTTAKRSDPDPSSSSRPTFPITFWFHLGQKIKSFVP